MVDLATRPAPPPADTATSPTPPSGHPTPAHAAPVQRRSRLWIVALSVAVVANAVVLLRPDVPVLQPVFGLILLFVLPTLLLRATLRWSDRGPGTESVLYSLGLTVLGLMVGGLTLNTVLPLVGIDRPLAPLPVLIGVDAAILGLAVANARRRVGVRPRPEAIETAANETAADGRRTGGVRSGLLIGTGALLVLGAIAGATRLNNGAGGQVSTAMLGLATALVVALLVWSPRLRRGVVAGTVYLLSLALLLMTSLRGWFVTGHDIQREYFVFSATAAAQHWVPDAVASAYNACLSITILPTMIFGLTAVPGPYVLKAVFPLVFAAAPVIVWVLARRLCPPRIALLAAVYFVAFPTFFSDMPFLARQQIAFLLLGLVLLAATQPGWSFRRRTGWALLLSCGVGLAHYSTNYVLIATLVGAWIVGLVLRPAAVTGLFARLPFGRRPSLANPTRAVLGPLVFVPLLLVALVWTGPITHSGGQLGKTADAVASAITGSGGTRSSDASYGLFSGAEPSPEQRLADFRAQTLRTTSGERSDGDYYSERTLAAYPTPVEATQELPLTGLGETLQSTGVDVSTVNSVLRSASAKLLQIFVLLGFAVVLFGRLPGGRRIGREPFALALASFAVVGAQVVLPAVSVDYGLLRAFQQALFVLAPFVALGSVALFGFLKQRVALAGTLAVVFFASLTGLIPQLLGGYPPQLQLNNSGQYYDIYETQPQEVAAAQWLERDLGAERKQEQIVSTDAFTVTRLQNVGALNLNNNLYPTQVRRSAYVFLAPTTVERGTVTVSYQGDLINYRYPTAFLDEQKSLVFSSGEVRIYR